MMNYGPLQGLVTRMPADIATAAFKARVVPMLVDCWLDDYSIRWKGDQIVTTRNGLVEAEVLFDVAAGRLIAAWAINQGKSDQLRDKARMRGASVGGDRHYHRGHAIPNSMGGGLDINLVPQLGRINIGAFRRLDNRTIDHAGSLYFSYWIYGSDKAQRPNHIHQGLLTPGRAPEISRHVNRWRAPRAPAQLTVPDRI